MSRVKGSRVKAIVPDGFEPSEEDLRYAEAFRALDAALSACEHSEKVALRLSTCRNIWMTINAIYVDVRETIGHGEVPSPIASVMASLRFDGSGTRKGLAIQSLLGEAEQALAQARLKRRTWDERIELDQELESAIVQLNDKLARDRVRGLLGDARTGVDPALATPRVHPGIPEHWDSRFVALSVEEPGSAFQRLEHLGRIGERLVSAIRVLKVLVGFAREASLFDGDQEEWNGLVEALREAGESLELTSSAENVTWRAEDGNCHRLSEEPPKRDARAGDLAALLQYLKNQVDRAYKDLAIGFRPNVGTPPMPLPYVIDLSEHFPVIQGPRVDSPRLGTRDLQQRPDVTTRIAALECTVSESAYDLRTMAYHGDESAERVMYVIRRAIAETKAEGARLLLLPEYFIPRSGCEAVRELADDTGVIVVGGLEGVSDYGHQMPIANEHTVWMPGRGPGRTEGKRRPAAIEPRLRRSETQTIYLRTVVGNFAVLVCSELTEIDLVANLAGSREDLDLLLVPCANPRPEVFACLAMSDALRLYCAVVVSNSHVAAPGNIVTDDAVANSSGERGTAVFVPYGDPEKRSIAPRTIEIATENEIVRRPVVRVFDIELENMALGRGGKRQKGYLSAPQYRSSQRGGAPQV